MAPLLRIVASIEAAPVVLMVEMVQIILLQVRVAYQVVMVVRMVVVEEVVQMQVLLQHTLITLQQRLFMALVEEEEPVQHQIIQVVDIDMQKQTVRLVTKASAT